MSEINYPPEKLINPPAYEKKNYDLLILWMLKNNEVCQWSDFIQEPLEIPTSTLGRHLDDLQRSALVDKFSKGKYRITSKGEKKFYELSSAKEKKRRLNYPPKIILRRRNYDDWILWMVYNNYSCKWSDFIDEESPVRINQSSLSKNMKDLIENGFVKKEDKKYIITQSGKLEYSRMLQTYDLDRQTILEEETKRIEDITKDILPFFERFNIKDTDIQFRFLNNILKLPFETLEGSLDHEEDFWKVILYLSINHPDRYPDYISLENFSKKYKIDELDLQFNIRRIIEKKIYPVKFYELAVKPDKHYFFQFDEKLEMMLRAITEDHITKFAYLNKLFSRVANMSSTINDILEEISEILFHKDLKESLKEFLPEYINYLAYKIEAERKLVDTFDKIEGIIWREVQNYSIGTQKPQFIEECEAFYYIDPVILEVLEPYYKSKYTTSFNKAKRLIGNNEYLKALKIVDSAIKAGQKDLGIIILKSVILCFLEKNNQVIDLINNEIDISQNFQNDPQTAPIFLLLSLSYMTVGDIKSANDVVDTLFKNFPEHPLSFASKGLVEGYNLIHNLKPEKADLKSILDDIDKAISLDSNDPNKSRYFQLKSTILLGSSKYDKAIEAIDNAIRLNTEKFDIYDSKINVLLYSNRYSELLKLLDELIELFPDSEKYLKIKKAYIHKNMRNLEAGLKLIHELERKYPDDSDIHNTKVYFLQYLNRKEEAIDSIKKLIEKDPNKAMFHDTYGEMLMNFQEYEDASKEFLKAIELEPYEWFTFQTYIKLGICYKELGNYEEAEENLKRGIDLTNKCYCDYDIKNKWLSIANVFINEIEEIKE
jgi:tetratricopeptide (TPR) repeat protein/DNA-binding HxlR family transcriptional regulator